MVANLGDKLIIEDVEKFIKDRRKVQWSQDLGVKKSVDFIFIPFYRAENTEDIGFVAIEATKIGEFQRLCKEVKEAEGGWGSIGVTKYEFTVTKQFKYGQNNEQTFRFLVFQNASYKPFQHRFTEVADSTEAGTTLGNFVKAHGDLAEKFAFGKDILGALKAVIGDDLRSF